MNSSKVIDTIYKCSQGYLNNTKSRRLADMIHKELMEYINNDDPNKDSPARILTRDELIQDIHTEIQSCSGRDKLAFITELNKLEDNYKGKTETDIHITIVDYGSAELASTIKAETKDQVDNIIDLRNKA